jgi:hypothetical protein
MKNKAHLTYTGMDEIRKIKAGMNTARKLVGAFSTRINNVFIYKISPAALRKVLVNDNTSSEALAQGATAQEDDNTSSEAPAQATAQENGIVDT